ncbi:hypothetical protein L7F22_029103 [Adiantum nelumboides]|nr:hypothetical protein [Adiantum nelumboides]
MKKILMIAATIATLSATTFADAAENMFYLKANTGANWMNKVTTNGIRIKGKAAPVFMLAAGYYVMDNVRANLSLEMVSNPQLKGSVRHKGNVAALMVNAYVDMFDVSVAGIFVGVGASRVKDKATGSSAAGSASDSTKTNLAYQLTVGASAEMAPGVKAKLAYSWRDYGKTGKYKNNPAISKTHFRGHNVIAGVRFNL